MLLGFEMNTKNTQRLGVLCIHIHHLLYYINICMYMYICTNVYIYVYIDIHIKDVFGEMIFRLLK